MTFTKGQIPWNKGRLRLDFSGPNHFAWKGGIRISDQGYIFLLDKTHPHSNHGYVREHRLVMEKHLGRYLSQEEEVHHINGDRKDNRIENLQLMTKAEHRKVEQTINMSDRICFNCGSNTSYDRHWIRSKVSGQLLCQTCNSKEYRGLHK